MLHLRTNILVFSGDTRAEPRRELAQRVVERALQRDCWLTLQAVSEFYAATTRKGLMPPAESGCEAILTENMADGVVIAVVRVVNPFEGAVLSDGAAHLLGAGD